MDKAQRARRKVEKAIQDCARAVIDANAEDYHGAHIEAEAAAEQIASASRVYRQLWEEARTS